MAQCLLERWNSQAAPIPTDRAHLARFILPSSVGFSLLSPHCSPVCGKPRYHATKCDCDHGDLTSPDRGTNSPVARGRNAVVSPCGTGLAEPTKRATKADGPLADALRDRCTNTAACCHSTPRTATEGPRSCCSLPINAASLAT